MKGMYLVLATSILLILIAAAWILLMPSQTLAPDFSLTSLEGKDFKLSDFRGKVVVIYFMATWCGPCRGQMPHLKVFWEKYEGQVVLISISVSPLTDSVEVLQQYSRKYNATWIWARDTANVARDYKVTAIPTIVIVDKEGYIRFSHVGVVDASSLSREVERLLRP